MISALGMCDRDFTRQTFGVQDADPFRLRSTRQGIAQHHELVSAESRQNIVARRFATSTRTSSPVWCPAESLMCLKSSRSKNNSATKLS